MADAPLTPPMSLDEAFDVATHAFLHGCTDRKSIRVIMDVLRVRVDAHVVAPQPPRPGTAPPDAETVGLIARARLAMKCAVDWEKTREGRPPSQTCLFEIQDAEEWMRTRGIDIGHPTTPTPKDAQ